jgi:release factor H-coupled RctB family protein
METAALEQLARVASLPGCRCAVGMPDLHPGRGIPIGAAFAFAGVVHPALVGGDAGCGARVFGVAKAKHEGDALLRRVDEATVGPALPDVDPGALLAAVWRDGPRALAALDGVPDTLAELAADETDDLAPSGPPPAEPRLGEQIGTVGGGNHFAEIARVRGRGFGAVAVVVHTGSRGAGGLLAERWHAPLADPAEYLADLAGAVRFARANRLVTAWRLLRALGAARPSSIVATFDLTHNHVVPATLDGEAVWLHRKGCAPAEADQPTIVLGSRGTESWIMRGAGRADLLWSVAHGAGRRMGRSEALAKLKARYPRASLVRTAAGGHVVCDDPALLYEEHPDAYKPVEPVVASLEAAGAASRLVSLTPLVTVKR